MQHMGDPDKQPLDQEDLISRIREMEDLSRKIEPELDLEHKNEWFSAWIMRYALVGVEVKRILMHAEEVLDDDELVALKHWLNTEIQPIVVNRFEKYRNTNYETEAGL